MRNTLKKLQSFAARSDTKAVLAAGALMLAAGPAMAQSFSLPGFSELACTVIGWLKGELAVMIFFVVVVVTLLVGFFAKMDWVKILGVIVLYGLLQGSVSLFATYVGTGNLSCLH